MISKVITPETIKDDKNIYKDDIELARIIQLYSVGLISRNNKAEFAFLTYDNKDILYIGANRKRFHYRKIIEANAATGSIVEVVEIDPERCAEIKHLRWIKRIVCCDIREIFVTPFCLPLYGTIIWSHGPTVINDGCEIVEIIKKLENMAEDVIILMVPWGKCKQSDSTKDIDLNKSCIPPEVFLEMGYSVNCIGKENEHNSNLLAWKFKL